MADNEKNYPADNIDDNENPEIVVLQDSDGSTIRCIALGTFDVEQYAGKLYCAFSEVDDIGNESDDVIILEARFVDDDKEMLDLLPIEDEKELNTAYETFLKLMDED